MNRKAVGSQTTILWFVFLLIMVLLALAAGNAIFFGSGYDYRQTNADLLNYKIKECLSEKDISLENETFAEEFYSKCLLKREVVEKDFFVLIKVNGTKIYEAGPGDETQCTLSDIYDEAPRCQSSTITKQGNNLSIQTGNNQKAKEVAA